MAAALRDKQLDDDNDVAAIITAMTDAEEPFLYETVASVLGNRGIGQVLLCVEENNPWVSSTLSELADDNRLTILRLPLTPVGIVRNIATQQVQLPWIAFCDGDDAWCKDKIVTQKTIAKDTNCDFVGADHYLIDEQGKIRACAIAQSLPMLSSWLVKTNIMRQYPFSETMRGSEDGRWWVSTSNKTNRVRCPQPLLRYRVRSGSLSAGKPSQRRKAKVVSVAKLPFIGWTVRWLTYCLWYYNRRTTYIHPARNKKAPVA